MAGNYQGWSNQTPQAPMSATQQPYQYYAQTSQPQIPQMNYIQPNPNSTPQSQYQAQVYMPATVAVNANQYQNNYAYQAVSTAVYQGNYAQQYAQASQYQQASQSYSQTYNAGNNSGYSQTNKTSQSNQQVYPQSNPPYTQGYQQAYTQSNQQTYQQPNQQMHPQSNQQTYTQSNQQTYTQSNRAYQGNSRESYNQNNRNSYNQSNNRNNRDSYNHQGKQGYNSNRGQNNHHSNQTSQQEKQAHEPVVAKSKSPLNDFGDMGAAVEKYLDPAASSSGHTSFFEGPKTVDNNPYRQQHNISAWDSFNKMQIPDPYTRFEDFPGITQKQLDCLYQAGFQAPTPIQAQTWPIALKSRDVISIAKTGSGKTLAFLFPGYQKIQNSHSRPNSCIQMLILAPTRELATQIQEEAERFGSPAGFYSACAYGGAPKPQQLRAIQSGISVLVATPGRLNDFLDSNQVNLSSVMYFVLDEADRMLDLGFEPQIRSIVRRLPRKRQTLMFSATWPESVQKLANDFLYEPVQVRLGTTHTGLHANEDIKQHIILLRSGEEKDSELVSLIRSRFERNRELVLIFVSRRNICDFVTNMLTRVGIPASAMHGEFDQDYRERTLAAFRDGSRPILVATDVASRGIDVKGISGVVNYDLPNSTEDYVHRIGRTGRAGKAGESFTFLTHSNEDIWKAIGIVEVMEKTNQQPPPEVIETIQRLKSRQQQNLNRRAAENAQFMKVLLVAEKPSVAKMLAEHLSGNRFRIRKGQSRANQIFEFQRWFAPAQQRCKLMVTSVVGHVFGLNFENGRVRDLSELFNAKVQKTVEETTKKLRIVEHLQELGAEADYLFLWLDCDREGENIGFEVISLTKDHIHYDNVYRARFSALTADELIYAYDNPVRPDKYAAMSVDARQELDLKIGVAFSRMMTKSFLNMAKEKFFLREQRVISYGPCQTPTLWFCVQRHKEIKNFMTKQFFNVHLVIDVQGKQTAFRWTEGTVPDEHQLNEMEKSVKQARHAVVTDITEDSKKISKPIGLNTVTLLKACSKGLGISPSAAMHAAEHLYTSGYISYPRTETTKYPPSFDVMGALQEQTYHPHWGRVASDLVNSGRIKRPERGFDVGDHPPITPIRAARREEFQKGAEWKIYDYVTRHFIASLHEDMYYSEKKLVIDVNGYKFDYAWHEVTEKGFMFAMPWKERGLRLNENNFQCNLSPGNQLPVVRFTYEEDYTKPPDYLQESELISLMDKHGIGTDASIPQHIKNIQERHYVDVCGPGQDGVKGQVIRASKPFKGKDGKWTTQQQGERPTSRHMVPRGFGLAFLSCFEQIDNELCDPSIRAYMEKQVSKIATGETDKNDVVNNNLKLFYDKFIFFQSKLDMVTKFFAPKGSNFQGANQGRGRFVEYANQNNPRTNFRNDNNSHQNNWNGGRGGGGGFTNRGRGRGAGRGTDRGGGFYNNNRGGNFRGRGGGRGNFNDNSSFSNRKRGHGNSSFDDSKRQFQQN